VVQRGLGPHLVRVHGRGAVHHVVVDPVLGERRTAGSTPQPLGVRLVVAEQHPRVAVRLEAQPAQAAVPGHQPVTLTADRRPPVLTGQAPRPRVPEPQGGQQVERGLLRAGIGDPDPDQQVLRACLRVVDLDHPVPVAGEDAGVDQLVLRPVLAPAAVLRDQVGVRELALRVVVPPRHPRVRRSGVGVPPVLLDVLAVVALRARQAEHPLLEDRVHPVPQGQSEAEGLRGVAHRRHPVLVPAVGAPAGVVVREELPGLAVLAVVLPDGAPGPLRHVRAPGAPGQDPGVGLGEPLPLGTLDVAHACR
jgi:hypothetical protein